MDQVRDVTSAALPFVLALFMAANLAAIGLDLELRTALTPLRNWRFVSLALLWDWLFLHTFWRAH